MTDNEAPATFEPVEIRMTRAACEALATSKEGRHEDYRTNLADWNATPAADREPGGEPEPCLAYEAASRALEVRGSYTSTRRRRGPPDRVTLRVADARTAVDLYYAACSGTFQIENLRVARRIADALRDRVRAADPEMVRRWPEPSGG